MSDNNAIIPLYLNKNMINNLFTVVIEKYAKVQKLNTKKQVIIKANTPLSNVISDSYCQGDFSFQYLDEYSKEKTEERVSIIVMTLLKLKNILGENNILSFIEKDESIKSIKEYDFIEVSTELFHNPYMERIKEIIKILQLQLTFRIDCNSEKDFNNKKNLLDMLKENVEEYNNSRCQKYITPYLFGGKYKAIIPIDSKYMEDSLDYLHDSKVTILGKVIRVIEDNNSEKVNLLSGTCFDYIDDDYFLDFVKSYTNNASIMDFTNLKNQTNCPLIEIVPIAIYI
ncbi:DUF6414 family protein [Clostridium grantii]|uniref:Uncharacterized protein n=1 Tax=Clostridium grantii DSM 8605 TaxID=1121316 RepID=A0A1M5TTU8_9CLOT|nr:hypothetical protein [Clostridium grantii]SHH54006.1 hypothetical protein SAMN02745207_01483 [Clostridium grantii DSM 8605]